MYITIITTDLCMGIPHYMTVEEIREVTLEVNTSVHWQSSYSTVDCPQKLRFKRSCYSIGYSGMT